MSNPEDKASRAREGEPTGGGTAQPTGTPVDPNYPGYILTFSVPGMTPAVWEVRGPHTDFFLSPNPDVKLKVEVDHVPENPAPAVPNLTIKITPVS